MHHLDRADLLDEHGGSDIVQVAPSAISFDRGSELIAAVRPIRAARTGVTAEPNETRLSAKVTRFFWMARPRRGCGVR
ncbi:hypothetical protein [Sorangium sp. So ce426]|uniref:hypothetical protein n=1 Tax=Sorangium sp. So ce426 TaxID=3133312 RepID=UPI003F5BA84B